MPSNEVFIHPTAAVHPGARLDYGVSVGPSCFLGGNVTIHKNTKLAGHVHIDGRTEIGEACSFSPFSTIGSEPQDVGYRGEATRVQIGDRNVFREGITIHRGTVKGGGVTLIGHDNYFMVYSHFGHDCRVGSGTVFINNATLGGHVIVEDFATVGAFCGVHQFCRIGKYAFLGGFTVITQDVLPFCRVAGMRPVLFYGMNAIGLRRRSFSRERIQVIKDMFGIIFHSGLNTTQAVEKILEESPAGEDRDEIINFIRGSKRGIIRKVSEQWEDESE